MKKTVHILSLILIMIHFALPLSGCSFIDSIFGYSPKIFACGNVIQWAAVKNAVSYEIYVNNEHYDSTIELFYIFVDLSKDSDVTVTAKNENGKESSKSNSVTIQQTSEFSNEESLTISLGVNSKYSINESIKYVKLLGSTTWGEIKIRENRSSNLIIELQDVNMTSYTDSSCISTENSSLDELPFVVIFIVKGTNMLTGSTPSQPSSVPEANSERKGATGGVGSCPVILPTMVIIGDGTLKLTGGKGGTGGVGAASTTWSTSVYGDGGDGGNGGDGLRYNALYIKDGVRLMTIGGEGGKGGSPGGNGSVITGPWNTSNWNQHYGKSGSDGSAYVGEQIIITGGEQYAENYTTRIVIFWCVIGVIGVITVIGLVNYIRIVKKHKK